MNLYQNIDLRFNLEGIEKFPPILYKFRDWDNIYHRNVLIKQKLFISSIELLNDPFDGTIIVNHKLKPVSKVEIHKLLGLNDNMPIPLENVIQKVSADFELEMNRNLNYAIRKTGILSLTSSKENILLWSHYANGHTGYAIGFDSEKLAKVIGELRLQSFIKEVFYTETYPEITFEFDLLKNKDEMLLLKAVIYSLTSKSDLWSYEDEYRILTFAKNNLEFFFPKECVKEIILGFRMDEKNKKEIVDISRKLYPAAKILMCQKEPQKYAVSFKEITE
ncbi:MAG: DUF2971 domain-containing protein [Prolixibacteraceae bacterium]|jgi:hypothetical protein|nr:DUF2971 domain-containing protein [Prolixibacteraceae bacterium]